MEKTFEERIQDWVNDFDKASKMPMHGILPSPPDPRDYAVEDIPVATVRIPDFHILNESPIVYNQGQTPYCGGASGAGIATAYYDVYNMVPKGGFSMTFLYWLSKQYDGIPDIDGTYIRTILKMMHKYGCAPLGTTPFSVNKIDITPNALKEAENYRIESYARLNNMNDIKQAMVKGLYVIIGTLVTKDNWSRVGGYLSFPAGELYGGHATFLYGYDNSIDNSGIDPHIGYYLGQNSWGTDWGNGGMFFLPYDYHGMKVDNKNTFLEAWAVKFPEVSAKKEDESKISCPKRDKVLKLIKDKYKRVRIF